MKYTLNDLIHVKGITETSQLVDALLQENEELRAKLKELENQKPVAWLHETRRDSDVVTDAVKHVWGKPAVGSMAAYSIPLYALPGSQNVPSKPAVNWGYRLVPLEPTDEMVCIATAEYVQSCSRRLHPNIAWRRAFQAMIAAAPN